MTGLAGRAGGVLAGPDPSDKIRLSLALADDWRQGRVLAIGAARPSLHPARPARPEILPPGRMKRRGAGVGSSGKAVLLHALAHIELNAIDLAWDLVARALDTAPPLMAKLRQAGDGAALAVMQRIFEDEIAHVAIGARLFDWACRRAACDPAATYQRLVSPHFPKGLKAPFNDADRQRAGLPAAYYRPLAGVPR